MYNSQKILSDHHSWIFGDTLDKPLENEDAEQAVETSTKGRYMLQDLPVEGLEEIIDSMPRRLEPVSCF